MEKIKTYLITDGTTKFYGTHLKSMIDGIVDEDGELEEDSEYTIKVERKFTQKELDEMSEFDGF